MHITKIDFRCGISPISRILQFEPHLIHILSNLFVAHAASLDKGLLHYNFKIPVCITSKPKNLKRCLREIGIMQRYAVANIGSTK